MYKVFISGPYSQGDVEKNVGNAMNMANSLIEHGFAPYCPHLTHFLHINNWQPYERWLEIDNEYLVLCDAVIRIPGESPGAEKEVLLAKSNGIPVFHSLDDLMKYFSTKHGLSK